MKPKKLYECLRRGAHANVAFRDFIALVEAFGFRLDSSRGDHFLYVHPQSPDDLNLQPEQGEAKPYQIKQFLAAVRSYNLTMKD